jgi:hypothetical protein
VRYTVIHYNQHGVERVVVLHSLSLALDEVYHMQAETDGSVSELRDDSDNVLAYRDWIHDDLSWTVFIPDPSLTLEEADRREAVMSAVTTSQLPDTPQAQFFFELLDEYYDGRVPLLVAWAALEAARQSARPG